MQVSIEAVGMIGKDVVEECSDAVDVGIVAEAGIVVIVAKALDVMEEDNWDKVLQDLARVFWTSAWVFSCWT